MPNNVAPARIPQPKPDPLLKNIKDIDTQAPVQSLMRLARTYGPIFRLSLPPGDLLVVSSQGLVNELCDEKRFDRQAPGAARRRVRARGKRAGGSRAAASGSAGRCRRGGPQQPELQPGTVIENRELVDVSAPAARSKRHLDIALPSGVAYRAGDYLAVLPTNPAPNVARALRRFGFERDTQVVIQPSTGNETALPVGYPVGVRELLSSYVELGQPATRRQIEALVAATACPPEKRELERLLQDSVYEAEILDKRASLLDLLER